MFFFREIVLLGCKYSKNGTRILDKVKLHFWIDFILVQFCPKKTFFVTSNYPGNTNSITRVRVSSYYPGTRVLGYPLDALPATKRVETVRNNSLGRFEANEHNWQMDGKVLVQND